MSYALKRRNLSGMYTVYKFEDEHAPQPTCFEDCPVSHQNTLLEQLSQDELKDLVKTLAKELRKVGDQFEIQAS